MIRVEDGLTLTDIPIIFYENLVTIDNVYAESDPDFPDSNVANPSTSSKWVLDESDSPVAAVVYFTIDISDSVNYVAIAGHNFNSANVAVGLELSSVSSPIGGAESLFEPVVPDNDGPLIFIFDPRELEAVRIAIIPGNSAAEMAVVYTGTYMTMEEGIQADHVPLPLGHNYEVLSGKSENGQFLGRIVKSHGYASSASFANMSKAWIRSDLIPFIKNAAEYPFFYAWSPLTYPDETAFVWLENDPQPSFDIDGYGSIDLQMRGLAIP